MKAPSDQPNADSAAVTNLAKSAMRGGSANFILGRFLRASETPPNNAPSSLGYALSKSSQKVFSSLRLLGGMGGSLMIKALSKRSSLEANSVIPLRHIGRVA